MDVTVTTLRNKTNRDQSALIAGQAYLLPALAEDFYDPAIADQILAQLGDDVVEKVDPELIGRPYQPMGRPTTLWVANMTGNPDVPEHVEVGGTVTDPTTGVKKPKLARNPKRVATPISREFIPSSEVRTGPSGMTEGFQPLAEVVTIPAFQRRELQFDLAQWFLNRDSMRAPTLQGMVIESRPRSTFEPDNTWALDDMRCYLRITDLSAEIGPSEKQCKTGKDLATARLTCLRRLHQRCADPKYTLPTRAQFEDFRTGFDSDSGEYVKPAEAAAIVEQALAKAKKTKAPAEARAELAVE